MASVKAQGMIKQRAYGFCEGAVDDKTESVWLL